MKGMGRLKIILLSLFVLGSSARGFVPALWDRVENAPARVVEASTIVAGPLSAPAAVRTLDAPAVALAGPRRIERFDLLSSSWFREPRPSSLASPDPSRASGLSPPVLLFA